MIDSRSTIVCEVTRLLAVLASLAGMALGGCQQQQQRHSAGHNPTLKDPPPEFEMRQDRPPTQKTLFTMADILAVQGKDRQCEFVLRRCIQEYPQFMPAYNRLAELLMRQGRANEAVMMLAAAIQIRPDDPVLLNNMGMCLIIRQEYGKALEHFTLAAGLRPENKKYRANMATALGLLGRHEESLALLQQCLFEQDAGHNAEVLHEASEKVAGTPIGIQG
jgi:Flp pilus assembly protein TadD